MHDERFDKLAKLLVEYSIRLKRNETVLIEAFDIPDEMTAALIRAAENAGGVPFAQVYHARVSRALALETSDRQLNIMASHELARMKKMNAYIAMRGSHNITELADVPAEKMQLIGKKMRPVQDQRVKRTKWVVLRWPTPSMAQLAGMSTEAFEDFFFNVCTLDYRKLQPGIKAPRSMVSSSISDEVKSSRRRATRPKNSTRYSTQIPARVTSGNFRSALIRECSSRCATSCSTKKLPAHSISLQVKLTRMPTTETEARSTGIWLAFSVPITAAAKSS